MRLEGLKKGYIYLYIYIHIYKTVKSVKSIFISIYIYMKIEGDNGESFGYDS